MKKKIYYKDVPKFLGFEYLIAKNVPMYDSVKFGPVIDLEPRAMEMMAAKAIISSGAPLRGKEVHLLRSAFDLSLEKFSRELDLSAATILKWEKASESFLSNPNEIAVRLFAAEKLGIELKLNYSELKSDHVLKPIEIKAS